MVFCQNLSTVLNSIVILLEENLVKGEGSDSFFVQPVLDPDVSRPRG